MLPTFNSVDQHGLKTGIDKLHILSESNLALIRIPSQRLLTYLFIRLPESVSEKNDKGALQDEIIRMIVHQLHGTLREHQPEHCCEECMVQCSARVRNHHH